MGAGSSEGSDPIVGKCWQTKPAIAPLEAPRAPGSRRVVVLVDREPSRDEYARIALTLLPQLLPRLLGPGDQVIGMWIGADPEKEFSTLFLRYTVPLPPKRARPAILLAWRLA